MRTKVMTLVLPFALCMALAVGVQARGRKSSSASKGSHETLTGCLQTGSSPNTYMLNNVSGSMSSSKNNSSQMPGEMARSEGSSYTLVPEGNIDLQKWVGQRVRVSGRMATSTSSSSSSNPSASSSSGSGSENSSMSGSDFMVTSVRKTSGTCQ